VTLLLILVFSYSVEAISRPLAALKVRARTTVGRSTRLLTKLKNEPLQLHSQFAFINTNNWKE